MKEVILFGSQLVQENSESDYDVLIIIKEKPSWKTEREISDICYEIELKHGVIIDSHILGEDEINSPRGKQPVFLQCCFKRTSCMISDDDRKTLVSYRIQNIFPAKPSDKLKMF